MSKKGKLVLWAVVSLMLGMLFMNMYLNLNETEVNINESKVTEVRYKPYLQRNEIHHEDVRPVGNVFGDQGKRIQQCQDEEVNNSGTDGGHDYGEA